MYVVPVKSTMEILQNFVAFLEYMNFKKQPFEPKVLLKLHQWNNFNYLF